MLIAKQTLLGGMLMISLIAPCVALHPPGEEPRPLPAPLSPLYDPYWVTGTVHTHDANARASGTAPYSMRVTKVEPYKT